MKTIQKLDQALALGRLSTAPANSVDGTIYYDTTVNRFRKKVNGSWVEDVLPSDLANYYTKSEVDAIINGLTTTDIEEGTNQYFTTTRARTASVVNNTTGNETDQAASVSAMKAYVAAEVASVDLTNYYDKTETDSLLAAKANSSDLTQEIADRQAADALLVPLASKNQANGVAGLDSSGKILESVIPNLSATYISVTEKGAALGVATLDAAGKLPVSMLPASVMEYKGTFDASTNTPTLVNGTGNTGDTYKVAVAGTVDFGAGDITFKAGDWVIYNGSIWEKSVNSDSVDSVNGYQGVVVLDTDDISEGLTNQYFTNTRAKTAAVINSTAGNETDMAPSVAAVKSLVAASTPTGMVKSVNGQLPDGAGAVTITTANITEDTNLYFTDTRAKTASVVNSTAGSQVDQAASVSAMKAYVTGQGYIKEVVEDTSPTLGGDLEVASRAIEGAASDIVLAGQNSVKRAKQASKSQFIEEEYIHAISIPATASTTVLSFPVATYDAIEITYKVKNISTSAVRIGTMRILTDGTNAYILDSSGESTSMSLDFDVILNAGNIELQSTSSVALTMRADIKKFLV